MQEIWKLLQELIAEKGWSIDKAAKSIKVVDADGDFVVRLWPTYHSLELILSSIQAAGGQEDEAEHIRKDLSLLIGKRVTAKNPSPQAKDLLPVWIEFVEGVLPRYIAAKKKAKARLRSAFDAASH